MKNILFYKNVFITIIIIIIFAFVAKSMFTNYQLKKQEIEQKIKDLEKGKLLIEKWIIVDREYEKLIQGLFTGDPLNFKRFVEKQTQALNVNVNSLTPTREDKDFYVETVVNLRVSVKSYNDIIKFIKSLEEKNTITETLRMRKGYEEKREAELSLKNYILKE